MNNKGLLLVGALLLVTVGVLFSYYNFMRPVKVVEIKDDPLSVLNADEQGNFVENTTWYETKITYPKNSQLVSDKIFASYKNFETETGIKNYTTDAEARAGLAINVPELKYSYYAKYKLATSTNTVTYVYQIYTFTGGAHEGTAIVPVTINDKLEEVPVELILPSNKLEKVSQLVRADLTAQKRERLKSFGMTEKELDEFLSNDTFLEDGIKPTRDNYNAVWLEGENIVIAFQQYQVGPYVEGIYFVKIPKNQI